MQLPAFILPTPSSTFLNSRPRLRQQSFLSSFKPSSIPLPITRRRSTITCLQQSTKIDAPTLSPLSDTGYHLHNWTYKSFTIQYAAAGLEPSHPSKPAIILIHGFGANCQHWRNNILPLSKLGYRVYALDLLGFGLGDKPAPGTLDSESNPVVYRFEYWTHQLLTFLRQIAEPTGRPAFLVANSIGAMVTMQLAVEHPELVAAQVLISPSLRQLNIRKRSWLQDLTAPLLMKVLAYRPLGAFFLNAIAEPKQLRKVLESAYAVHGALDDTLLSILGKPAFTHGALEVFLSFIMYDDGPIPEDFLPVLTQPSLVIWGEEDRFEPYELGQALKHYSAVERFVPLPDVGHCAHDENPEQVNALIGEFLESHANRADVPSG